MFVCLNSNCILYNEFVESSFKFFEKNNDICLKCKYCEKVFVCDVVMEIEV